MIFFPNEYAKPRLLGIVEASEFGWGAVCSIGNDAAGGGSVCSTGNGAGKTTPICVGGGSAAKGDVYRRTSDSERLFNVDDMSHGL